jgi:hypothetical protein
MIRPDLVEEFNQTALLYEKYKDQIKKYVKDRYENTTGRPISVVSVCVGFQMVIANIPQSAVTAWLDEWGYKVEPGAKGKNHLVYLQPIQLNTLERQQINSKRNLIGDIPEPSQPKERPQFKKGTIIY